MGISLLAPNKNPHYAPIEGFQRTISPWLGPGARWLAQTVGVCDLSVHCVFSAQSYALRQPARYPLTSGGV
jgi:hypothetical protein